jgi:hypothetical protein
MPYRTMDNRIDGVVITFADITAAKKVEAGLRAKQSEMATHSAKQESPPGRTSFPTLCGAAISPDFQCLFGGHICGPR